MGMSPTEIADQLLSSGKITKDEKEDWTLYGTEYSLDTAEDKANHDKVEALVKNYNESKTPPDLTGNTKVDTLTYPEDKIKGPSTEGMPAVLNSSGDKNSSVSVSTEALKTFSANLATLETLVTGQHTAVKGVAISPGTFGAGVYITEAIQKGLRGDTLRFLQSVRDTFAYIQADITTMITEYDTTEERSKMTTQQLNNLFNDAFGNIQNYSEYGHSNTDNIGGDSDDKKDDKKK